MKTGTQGDQSTVVFFEQFFVDPWLVIESLHVAQRYQLAEITVTFQIHCQENEVVVVFFRSLVHALSFKSAHRRHIDLAADDGLDAVTHGLRIELDRPEHVAVVGDGKSGLFKLLDPL